MDTTAESATGALTSSSTGESSSSDDGASGSSTSSSGGNLCPAADPDLEGGLLWGDFSMIPGIPDGAIFSGVCSNFSTFEAGNHIYLKMQCAIEGSENPVDAMAVGIDTAAAMALVDSFAVDQTLFVQAFAAHASTITILRDDQGLVGMFGASYHQSPDFVIEPEEPVGGLLSPFAAPILRDMDCPTRPSDVTNADGERPWAVEFALEGGEPTVVFDDNSTRVDPDGFTYEIAVTQAMELDIVCGECRKFEVSFGIVRVVE